MLGDKFERLTNDQITSGALGEFAEYRYRLLTEGPGNICDTIDPVSYAPFYNNDYTHRNIVGHMSMEPWITLKNTNPKTLVHPNPFELSAVRTRKNHPAYRSWDSAIAIPACSMRSKLHHMRSVPVIRNINDHWNTTIKSAFERVGPLGHKNRILRPEGPYIIDLKNMGHFGWTLLEAAHVLGHLRGDGKPNAELYIEYHFQAAVMELTYAVLFDVPINATAKEDGEPGMPDTYYGVELKSSTYMEGPLLRVPITGNEALRVDDTLAVMLGAVLVEPVPYAYVSGTDMVDRNDIWAGTPSLVALVGWECPDFITHGPVCEYNNRINYAIQGADLLPPSSHWAYLALAKKHLPPPKTGPGQRWRYVHEWLASDDYKKLRAETPGLPCKTCYMVNQKTDGAPKRPRSKHPRGPKKHWPKPWLDYHTEKYKCADIGKKAVEAYEPIYYSGVDLPRLDPKKRLAANNKRVRLRKASFSRAKRLERAIARAEGKDPKPMTDAQMRLYEEYKKDKANGRI